MSENKVIDLTYLRDISMQDEEMVMEMIKVFLDGYEEALSEMRDLFESKDWVQLRARAHKFKPNLSYMGITSGIAVIEELENQAKNNNVDLNIDPALTKLKHTCDQASKELRNELEKMNIP